MKESIYNQIEALSARMRILLINNDKDNPNVNMMLPVTMLRMYKEVYTKVMGELFPHKMVYAKKYESLTVQQQFQPILFYEDYVLEINPDLEEDNKKLLASIKEQRDVYGIKTVITDDRIPKTGLYTIDKRQIELWGEEYTAKTIIDALFYSRFAAVGDIPLSEETHVE